MPAVSAQAVARVSTQPAWNPVVTQAMQYVKMRSDIPLVAPLFAGNGNGDSGEYLAATALATADRYQVGLQLSTKPVGLNSPLLDTTLSTGLAGVIGGFGARQYPTSAQALQQVVVTSHTRTDPETTNYIAPAGQGFHASRIDLGLGIWGTLYSQKYDVLLEWREGDWFFQVQDMSVSAARATAQPMVAYLHDYLLPETHGECIVDDAGDGQHTSLEYAVGNIVYSDWDYHYALSALRLAATMRPYAGSAEEVFPPVISQTMTQLANNPHIRIPLAAPRDYLLPPSAWVGAQTTVQTQPDQYTVSLYGGDASAVNQGEIASFGAQTFIGNPSARQYIAQMSGAPNYAGMASQRISLGHGIAGRVYNQMGFVLWHEGLWTLDVEAGSQVADVRLAAQIVTYLHTHLLPETNGMMWVKNTPAGQFSHLYWAYGDVVYNVYSLTSATRALHMAVSSEAY